MFLTHTHTHAMRTTAARDSAGHCHCRHAGPGYTHTRKRTRTVKRRSNTKAARAGRRRMCQPPRPGRLSHRWPTRARIPTET